MVLVGPMGSGKSSVGRQLAQRLHLDFVDLDKFIEDQAGTRITEIFNLEGEQGFRKRETLALEENSCLSDTIVSTGGGAILVEENRRMMRNGIVIYLSTSPEQQYLRIKDRTHRPNLDLHNPLEKLKEMMVIRGPLYRNEADFTVNTDRKSVEEVVREIETYLQD